MTWTTNPLKNGIIYFFSSEHCWQDSPASYDAITGCPNYVIQGKVGRKEEEKEEGKEIHGGKERLKKGDGSRKRQRGKERCMESKGWRERKKEKEEEIQGRKGDK